MCILFFEPLCGFYEIPAGVLRGTGHSLYPAIATIIGTCCFRILWIHTIFRQHCQLNILYYAFPISWILTLFLIIIGFVIINPIQHKYDIYVAYHFHCSQIIYKFFSKIIITRIHMYITIFYQPCCLKINI